MNGSFIYLSGIIPVRYNYMKFYNREKEIKVLDSIRRDFRIAVIGRRRIGKTRLVEHFYKDRCVTFFIPAEKAEKEIISGWVDEYTSLNLPKVDNFKEFFKFVFIHLNQKVIFLDEIQNSLKVNKSFIFDLQRAIDKYKPKLVISGSLISVMKKIVEDYKSPLYGRFDFIIKLNELDFKTIFTLCKNIGLSCEDSFKLFAIFGGVPKYYELIEKMKKVNVEELVLDMFVRYPRPLYEEIKTMLKEEFGREHKTFFSIISSISQGKNKSSEIAGFIGKKQTEITKYLSLLRSDFEVIQRETPFITKKRGIYVIKNNIISYWFRAIWRYNQLLETGDEKQAVNIVKKNLNKSISLRFETIIIDLLKAEVIKLPFTPDQISRQWGKFRGEKGKNDYEIDLVAIQNKSNQILFGECKWKDKVDAEKILKGLKEKSSYFSWPSEKEKEQRKEYFAIFAKSFKNKVDVFEGKNVYCIDLKDIEKKIIK
ncbi:hypothetical protein CL622_01305 [archaeon]|nr:hypothetical protein [archaeon]|tara:strand:+ start:2079 stop:3524 length:1446 start_codon:yes stop_codon:yes gene_type:complete